MYNFKILSKSCLSLKIIMVDEEWIYENINFQLEVIIWNSGCIISISSVHNKDGRGLQLTLLLKDELKHPCPLKVLHPVMARYRHLKPWNNKQFYGF